MKKLEEKHLRNIIRALSKGPIIGRALARQYWEVNGLSDPIVPEHVKVPKITLSMYRVDYRGYIK